MLRIIKKYFLHLLMTSISCSAGAYADTNDAAIKAKWDYTGDAGPTRWSELDPSFATCADGTRQSPIDINRTQSTIAGTLKIHYVAAPLNIVYDGITELKIKNQVVRFNGYGIQVNFSNQSNETISIAGNTYRLIQFHIHTPSENELSGEIAPLEIHFVHQSGQGEVVIMSVLAQGGPENAELKKVVDYLPQGKGKVSSPTGQMINPAALLPANRDYYSFTGSLTTPPCSEGIQWVVMAKPITVSPAQFAELKKAVGGPNARPVQPLNKRQIIFNTMK